MPQQRPTCEGKPGESSLNKTNSFFMPFVDHIIDNTCEVCKNDPCLWLALLVEHLCSTPHHTGPPNATHPGYGALHCSAKRCALSHLKLSVLLGVSHSHFSFHFFSFLQTQSQASRARRGPSSTANWPTTTSTSTLLYWAMMMIAIDNRWLQPARADTQLSNRTKNFNFGAVFEDLWPHLDEVLWIFWFFTFSFSFLCLVCDWLWNMDTDSSPTFILFVFNCAVIIDLKVPQPFISRS